MPLSYHRFDPGACNFPKPRVPVLPPLSWAQLSVKSHATQRDVRHYARGRYALKAAYELAGVGAQGALLAPAYHCRTMLDPALRLGAEVGLYALTSDLQTDLATVQRAAAACAVPAKALLFTHYFGLPRDIAPVADWCQTQGIALIEDCSHAMPFNGLDGDVPAHATGVGHTGRYAVSSPYKFFPCADGGLLWSPQGARLPDAPLTPPGARQELGAVWHAAQQLLHTPAAPSTAALADELHQIAVRPSTPGRDWIDDSGCGSTDYQASDEATRSLAASRWIQRHTDSALLMRKRRARYLQWVAAVAPLPGCQALLPDLPAGCTPYMFPLLVHQPSRRFYPLKHLGLPIWRWDDMAASDCAIAQRYRQGVFHLPCHQALTDGQMGWMTAAVAQAMLA